jgi:hypothetical protein
VWTATGIFAALLLMDGLGGVTRSPLGEEVLLHLGYSLYLMPFIGFENSGGCSSVANKIYCHKRMGLCPRLLVQLRLPRAVFTWFRYC